MGRFYTETQMPSDSSWVAAPVWLEALGGAVEGAATGFAAGQQVKMAKQKSEHAVQRARELRDGLITKGIDPKLANEVALEMVRTGKVLEALNDLDKTAAEVRAKNATAAGTEADTAVKTAQQPYVGPAAKAGVASTEAATAGRLADTEQTQTETGQMADELGIKKYTAETGRIGTETERMSVKHKIDQETLEWARKHDVNASGTIDPDERVKLLAAEYRAVQKEIRDEKDNPKVVRKGSSRLDWTKADIQTEVIRRVDDQIEAYEFSVQGVSQLGQKRYYGTGPDAGKVVRPDGEPAPDSTSAETQEAIRAVTSKKFQQGVTSEQIRAAIMADFPGANVDEVLKAIGR